MTRAELLELYRNRVSERALERARRRKSLNAVAIARVVVFLLGVLALWVVWETDALGWPWLLIPLGAFVLLINLHNRLREAFLRAERVEAFYTRGIERLEEQWRGKGVRGDGYAEPGHPYARDLDLFGKGSLFELLATTESPWGEATLARWLMKAAPAGEARLRQAAVRELAPKLDLREAIASERAPQRESVDAGALAKWATAPSVLTARWLSVVTLVLGVANVALVIAWLASLVERPPMLVVLFGSAFLGVWLRPKVLSVLREVDHPARDLSVLSVLLERFERESFQSDKLKELQASLTVNEAFASVRIGRLNRLIEYLDARRNQLFAPVAALLFWGTQFAFALESWRASTGSAVPHWLEAIGELDALLALGTYALEHPDDPYPELVDGEALFEATALGHPLIPDERLVCNDVRIGRELRLIVVSGSNMSGKSTLLRSMGIATVMGLAGAPVRARKLVLSPLAVAASIRIEDSLQEGISHFYAEILRIRQVMELASKGETVLFLLDEILHGTNSHDRRIGAEAVVRGLVERGAIGLITTHDLALSKLAETMGEKATNVHFEDQIENGEIRFDYVMREGVVKKSNALELMRSIGLEV